MSVDDTGESKAIRTMPPTVELLRRRAGQARDNGSSGIGGLLDMVTVSRAEREQRQDAEAALSNIERAQRQIEGAARRLQRERLAALRAEMRMLRTFAPFGGEEAGAAAVELARKVGRTARRALGEGEREVEISAADRATVANEARPAFDQARAIIAELRRRGRLSSADAARLDAEIASIEDALTGV